MSKHTPGPWRMTRFTGNKSWTVQRDDTHEALANVRTGEADARLMAAAPEMLKALKAVDAMAVLALRGRTIKEYAIPASALEEVIAAIAKAEAA